MAAKTRLRLDPWPPDYDSAVQFSQFEDHQAEIDVTVETAQWVEVEPEPPEAYNTVYFVDGVRRVEARVVAEDPSQIIHGLFGSLAVGCVRFSSCHATLDRQTVERFLILGGGLCQSESFTIGGTLLSFHGIATASKSPDEALGELQNAMRAREASLAQELAFDDNCVFADGPLTYFATSKHQVIGLVKSIYLPYLSATHFQLVSGLKLGCRTPIFAITDTKYNRYSWFMRIGEGRHHEHPLSGVIRLEVRAAIGLDIARRMANFAAQILPGCASTAVRDARAPQNLLPIGALETDLRHRLGDPLLIHRAIEDRLFEEVTL